ncbi:MAG: GMC family oxidoreductase, partial [Gammaproteobacteria bacterium]|nr:GMC family oxidoreductase [Gammaproteobacteria bacterium]
MDSADRGGTDAEHVWDVVVVGTGMGGATAGYELAKAGRKVLFLEKGPFAHRALAAAPEGLCQAELHPIAGSPAESADPVPARSRYGWWPHRAFVRSRTESFDFHLPVGCGSGGSTAFYAAGLERFSPADFMPRANFPDIADSTLPERWPISYEELQPFYDRAEALFRVRGTQDPLFSGGPSTVLDPPPLGAADADLMDSLRSSGLNPYRVHAGFEAIPGCNGCPTGHCPNACKSDAAWICLVPALLQHGARIMAECEVTRLDADGLRVRGVHCRRGQESMFIRAKVVILAAGALTTPALLLKSTSPQWPAGLANQSGLVGRNLMFHAGDFIALRSSVRNQPVGPRKTLALNDFYFADGKKLGTFQMLGVSLNADEVMQYLRDSSEANQAWWALFTRPAPVWWRKLMSPPMRLVLTIFRHLSKFEGAPIWASILEDLPYNHNRVYPDPDNPEQVIIEYQFSDELRQRIETFRAKLISALGREAVLVLSARYKIDYPHACGTCRIGDDPRDSVLDRNNRAHGISNLYVVDASFFPSSAGTNPSLTIAANALRVAQVINAHFELNVADSDCADVAQ